MKTISQTLREKVIESGLSQFQLYRESGVNRVSIGRFLAGRTGLSMEQLDMLAVYFGLELRPAKAKRKG